jgi:hypothetical protein
MRSARVRDYPAFHHDSANFQRRKCHLMSPPSITETQSPTVEELVTAFKRRGHFDTLRKATLSSFQGGVSLSLFYSESSA